MKLNDALKFGSCISKTIARDIFRLLLNYRDISASEAASRLGVHIQTVQDFLETLAELGILEKNEAGERKRPYFRYSLKSPVISFEINLEDELKDHAANSPGEMGIRERKNSGILFTTSRNGQYFSSVTILTGKGRERKEKRINLTTSQGKFLFNLPFPEADFLTPVEICEKAEVENENLSEILDLINELIENKVIEVK